MCTLSHFVVIMIWALHEMQVILVERLDTARILAVAIDFSCFWEWISGSNWHSIKWGLRSPSHSLTHTCWNMYDFPCCTTSIHSPHIYSVIVADPDWSTRWAFYSLWPSLRVLMSSSDGTAAVTLYLLPSLSGRDKISASWFRMSFGLSLTSAIKSCLQIELFVRTFDVWPVSNYIIYKSSLLLGAHLQLDITTGFPWNWCISFLLVSINPTILCVSLSSDIFPV